MDAPINFSAVIEQHCAVHADAQFYFLLDHAGLPGLLPMLNGCRAQWVSLFAGTRESMALPVAPILVRVGCQDNLLPSFLLDWIAQHGAFTSAVTLLASPLTMEALQCRLVARLDCKLSENMEVMLRFFDPRILAQLRITLTAEQARAFFGVASHWWYIDRAGELVGCDAAFADADPVCIPLVLSQAQEFQMVDASEADQVLALLHTNVPNLMREITKARRYDLVVKNICEARKAGLNSIHDFMIYMVEEESELHQNLT